METVRGATVSDQARTVIQDKSAVAYLGEIVPGSSAASLGITNALDILQVTPTDTALELTQTTPGGRERSRRVLRVAEHLRADVRAGRAEQRQGGQGAGPGDAEHSASRSCTCPPTAATTERRSPTRSSRTPAAPGSRVVGSPATADGAFYGSASPAVAARFFNGVAGSNPSAKLFGPSALDAPAFVSAAVAVGAEPLHLGPGLLEARA